MVKRSKFDRFGCFIPVVTGITLIPLGIGLLTSRQDVANNVRTTGVFFIALGVLTASMGFSWLLFEFIRIYKSGHSSSSSSMSSSSSSPLSAHHTTVESYIFHTNIDMQNGSQILNLEAPPSYLEATSEASLDKLSTVSFTPNTPPSYAEVVRLERWWKSHVDNTTSRETEDEEEAVQGPSGGGGHRQVTSSSRRFSV